jgi:hypothetical protein
MTVTSRTSKIVSDSQGEQVHHLYGAPMFYKDKSGNYKDVDMSHVDASSSIGNITLREKHSSSVGIRKDNNKAKYIGIRPDETQEDGTNQMEWSIVNVEFDGVSQNIDLSKNDVSGTMVDLGDVIVHNTKVYTRQLVKYNGTATDFKIEFDLHLQNMSILNDKYDGSYEFRKPCSLDITDIGEDIGTNIWENHILNPLQSTDSKKINVIIGKITDNHIMTSPLDKAEEFSDTSLSGYTTTEMANINSSMYMKDTICMCFQNQNLSLGFYDYIVKRLCKMWDCTFTEYAYFTDSNGKKFGSCIEDSLGRVFVFINTKEISNTIKDLFLRKSFSSTGYIDTTISDLKVKLKAYFNYSHSSIPVDTSYYKPNENGLFSIDNGIGQKYSIPYPVIFDKDFMPLEIGTYHTLKDNGDGTYRYTKYLNQESIMQESLLDCEYIDSTTNINASTDAKIWRSSGSLSSRTAAWNAIDHQQNATGAYVDWAYLYIDFGVLGGTGGGGYGPSTYTMTNYNNLFWFNTSSISSTVTAAKLYIAGGFEFQPGAGFYPDDEAIILKARDKGSDDTITVAEYLALDGIADGGEYVKSSITEYSNKFLFSDIWDWEAHDPIKSDIAYGNWTLLSAIHADIEDDDTVYLNIQAETVYEDTHNYDGSNPGLFIDQIQMEGSNFGGNHLQSGYHSCTSGEHPPYLAVTTGEAAAVTYNATFFGANF